MEDIVLSKFKGTLVGAALGAAMGKAVAEVPASQVLSYYGKAVGGFVKSHPSSPYDFLKPEEVPAEVELLKITVESLVETKSFEPYHFVSKLVEWLKKSEFHKYINPTLLNVLKGLAEGTPPEELYSRSSSITAILHTVAMGLFHHNYPTLAAEGAKALALILAKGKEISEGAQVIAAATALFVEGEFDLSLDEEKEKFLDEAAESCTELEEGRRYLERVKGALREKLTLSQAIEFFGNGEYVWESLPLSLYLTLKDIQYPQKAFLNAVNSYGEYGGATAAIGFLVGAWIGAYWGIEVFPPEWVDRVQYAKELTTLAEELYKIVNV